jgi:hypothetical protein
LICPFDEILEALGPGADSPLATRIQARVERLVKNFVRYEVEQGTFTDILPAPSQPAYADPLTGVDGWGCGHLSTYGGVRWGGFAHAQDRVFLKNLPVRSVSSVNYDPYRAFGPGTLVDPSGYLLDCEEDGLSSSGCLLSLYGSWPLSEPRSLRVTYVGGYTPDELDDRGSDFKMAVIEACQKFYNEVVANMAATRTAGVGAVARELVGNSEIWFESAAQTTGMMQSLPASVRLMLAPRVRMGY